jgi:hypothetical protein
MNSSLKIDLPNPSIIQDFTNKIGIKDFSSSGFSLPSFPSLSLSSPFLSSYGQGKKLYLVFGIVIILIIAISLFFIIKKMKLKNRTYIMGHPDDANKEYSISCKYAPFINEGTGLAGSLSIWFKIDDWQYLNNKDRYLIVREGMYIFLSPQSSDLNIAIKMMGGDKYHKLMIKNIQIQKYNNIIVSLENRQVDIWLNGELVQSTVLDNVPDINDDDRMSISCYGGFYGKIGAIFSVKHRMSYEEVKKSYEDGNKIPMTWRPSHSSHLKVSNS